MLHQFSPGPFRQPKPFALAVLIACCTGHSGQAFPRLHAQEISEPDDSGTVQQASMLQQTPFIEPRINIAEESSRAQRNAFTTPSSLLNSNTANSSAGSNRLGGIDSQRRTFLTKDSVLGEEALTLSTTDVGSLLKKSSSGLSAGVQSKTPVVSDPRVRGSRIGSLAASGVALGTRAR